MKIYTRDDLSMVQHIDHPNAPHFDIGYHMGLGCYVLDLEVDWICPYIRIYQLSEDGYRLCCEDVEQFIRLNFRNFDIVQGVHVVKIMGAHALREYACIQNLGHYIESHSTNAFKGHVVYEGTLWAYIECVDGDFIVPHMCVDRTKFPMIERVDAVVNKERQCVAEGIKVANLL